MPTSRLPLDIKSFLTDHIESVSQLEMLFLFYKDPLRKWTISNLSMELRSNTTSCTNQIHYFIERRFIKKIENEDAYIFLPSEDFKEKVKHLYETYTEKQVAVISYIYEKPTDKLKVFADAFKIKKD